MLRPSLSATFSRSALSHFVILSESAVSLGMQSIVLTMNYVSKKLLHCGYMCYIVCMRMKKVNGSQPCTEGQNLRGTDNSLVNCGTTSRLSRSKLSAN